MSLITKEQYMTVLQNYLKISDKEFVEFEELRHGQLVSSSSIQAISNEKYKKNEPNEVNASVLTVPSLQFDVYDSTSLFRSFELLSDEKSQSRNSYNNYLDKLINVLHARFNCLKGKFKVTFDDTDILDSLLLDNSRKFDVVDCSNVGEYVDPLALLLSALSRLKNKQSYISMHFMRVPRHKPCKDAIEACLGLTFSELKKYFNLKCSALKAYSAYVEAFWLKDENFKQAKVEDIKELLQKLFKMLKKQNKERNVRFSAASLVKVLHCIYSLHEPSSVIAALKDEIVECEKEYFYLELLTFLKMQLNDVYRANEDDQVIYLNFEMIFIDKNFLMLNQQLKQNEYDVHLVIYDENSKMFQKLSSFVFEIQSYEKAVVKFFCLKSFLEKSGKYKIQLCSEEFGKVTKLKKFNEASIITEAEIFKWLV